MSRVPAALWVVLAAGVAIRLFFMLSYRPAFFGIPDELGYANAAREDLFGDPLRTGSYALFLRVVHAFDADLSATVVVQHALGVAAALLLYMAVRRVGGPAWLGVLPAAIVLLGGTQIWLEHSLMSESIFTPLVAATLWCCVRSLDGREWEWLAFAGLLAGLAIAVRPAGFLLPLGIALWIATWPGRGLRLRAAHAALVPVVAAVPVMAYFFAHDASRYHHFGFARGEGWSIYARVAEFARCDRFEPPAGTRLLCEESPPSARPSANYYLYGGPAASPAARLYTGIPNGSAQLRAFAVRAIVHQPLDYGRVVLRDTLRAAGPSHWRRRGMGETTPDLIAELRDPYREGFALAAIPRYWSTRGFLRRNVSFLESYGRRARVEGLLTGIFAAVTMLGLVASRGRLRRGVALFGSAALALLVGPAATLFYSVRYATPAYGPLAAGAALSLPALWDLASRPASAARRWRAARGRRRPSARRAP